MKGRAAASVSPAAAVLGLFLTFGLIVASFFPFLSIYFADRGFDPSQIGFLLGAMAAVRIVAMPIWGHVADTRIGRRRALQLGLVGMVLFAIVASGARLARRRRVRRGRDRVGDGGIGPEHRRARARAARRRADGGLRPDPRVGEPLLRGGLPHVRLAARPLRRVARPSAVRGRGRADARLDDDRRATGPSEGAAKHGRLGAVGAVFRTAPRMWGFLVATLLVWTGFNGAWNFVGLKIEEPLLIGVGTALGGLTEVGVMRLSSRLHRGLGLRKVYALGCVVYAIGFLLWGLVESRTIVSLLAVFEGAGFSLLFTTSILVVGKLLPSSLYSTGNSIGAMVGFGIGPIIGAGLGGVVYGRLGSTTLFVGSARPGACSPWARRDGRAAHPRAGYAAARAAPARGRRAGARPVVTPRRA